MSFGEEGAIRKLNNIGKWEEDESKTEKKERARERRKQNKTKPNQTKPSQSLISEICAF